LECDDSASKVPSTAACGVNPRSVAIFINASAAGLS
jgi:hypothetical protein